MSKIYGLKYIYEFSMMEKYQLEYIILFESNGRYFIDKYFDGIKHHFDITDKIDDFCKKIENLGIEEWNMKYYEPKIYWFPPMHEDWSFEIHTDKVSVMCKGDAATPPYWEDFWKAFNKMCNDI